MTFYFLLVGFNLEIERITFARSMRTKHSQKPVTWIYCIFTTRLFQILCWLIRNRFIGIRWSLRICTRKNESLAQMWPNLIPVHISVFNTNKKQHTERNKTLNKRRSRKQLIFSPQHRKNNQSRHNACWRAMFFSLVVVAVFIIVVVFFFVNRLHFLLLFNFFSFHCEYFYYIFDYSRYSRHTMHVL